MRVQTLEKRQRHAVINAGSSARVCKMAPKRSLLIITSKGVFAHHDLEKKLKIYAPCSVWRLKSVTNPSKNSCLSACASVFISLIRMRSKRDIKMGRLCTPGGAVLGIVGGGCDVPFFKW